MSLFGQNETVEAAHSAFRQAEQLQEQGMFTHALPLNREIVSKYSRWPFGYYGLGNAYAGLGQFEDARKNLRKALNLKDDEAAFHAKIAEVFNRLDDPESAFEHIDRAIELQPQNLTFVVHKAMILRYNNDPRAAHGLLEPLIAGGERDEHMVRVYASLCGVIDEPERGIEVLLPFTETVHADPIVTASHFYVLAGLYNQTEQYDEAYDAAARGAELRGDHYDHDAREELCEARLRAWSAERMPELARSKVTSEQPVFIVGMPRSGTTLIEQIIAAHPKAYGAGELINIFAAADEIASPTPEQPDLAGVVAALKPATVDRTARKILRDMEKQAKKDTRGGGKPERITDKLPLNIQHLGLIEQLFPNARVVHCKRHPLDTFISCYLLDFEGVNAHAYSYSPAHFAHFYSIYERYMAHWHEVCTIPILDVEYEEVIADQLGQTERLLDFIGLPWDDACMAFHREERTVTTASSEQVRQRIYTSSRQRYKNFEHRLGPIRKAFEDHGVSLPGA
ncbi:MAG: sulfotransferase [Phycisphaerales bacterium]